MQPVRYNGTRTPEVHDAQVTCAPGDLWSGLRWKNHTALSCLQVDVDDVRTGLYRSARETNLSPHDWSLMDHAADDCVSRTLRTG